MFSQVFSYRTLDIAHGLRLVQAIELRRRHGGTVTGLVAPLGELVQFDGERLVVSCKTKPGVGGVHEIVAQPGAAGRIASVGALVVWTATGSAQNPPVRE